MRRRTIILVVMGLALALFVVPAAASELFAQTADEAAVVDEVIPGPFWDYYTEPHIVLYALPDPEADPDDDLPCALDDNVFPSFDADGKLVFVNGDGNATADPELDDACHAVLIEGPNGQVNHGQFVSNMVHSLKDGYDKDEDGPFGQWVKQFAQDTEIGKGDLKVKANDDDDSVASLDDDDDDDDDDRGVPNEHASDRSNNGNGNGKNK